jgi:hypothetical protein
MHLVAFRGLISVQTVKGPPQIGPIDGDCAAHSSFSSNIHCLRVLSGVQSSPPAYTNVKINLFNFKGDSFVRLL